MITKVVHGWRVGGLVAYLMGPGRAQEHTNPRVIATWDGRDAAWQPEQVEGEGLGRLIRALRAPAVAAGLPEQDAEGRRGYVWHLSARVAAGDRVLTDTEWAGVARELLDGAGVAARGDRGGPRWVAIRHAEDHIHVAVVLVRQDTGRRFWPSRDYPRLRATARRIEARMGLTLTAAADGTAARAPGRGELEKARRQGREPARLELARVVRSAAVAADGVVDFVAALRDAGYLVELRVAPSGDPLGYKIARPGDTTAAGEPVFYSGSKLAPDLSLPRLARSWTGIDGGEVLSTQAARRRVDRARLAVRTARAHPSGTAEGVAGGIAEATHAVLAALARAGSGLEAEQAFDRASRAPRSSPPVNGPTASGLRYVARQLIGQQKTLVRFGLGPDAASPAGVALVVAVCALVQELAAWHRDRERPQQADAAARTGDVVAAWLASRPETAGGVGPHPGSRQPGGPRPARGRPVDHAVTSPAPRDDRARAAASAPPRD